MPTKRQELIAALTEDMGQMKRLIASSHGAVDHSKKCPTRAQIGIMFVLSDGQASNLKDLAQKLHMTSSAVTQLINGLVRDKLLRRKEDPNDRRKTSLSLTEFGKKRLTEMQKGHQALYARLFASLSDEELKTWQTLQRKTITHFK